MLGWEFFITFGQNRLLATWVAGIDGTDWIDELVSQGHAQKLEGNGYPDRYEISAGVLSSILVNGVPQHEGALVIGDDYVHLPGHIDNVQIDIDTIRAIPSEAILSIEVWDQS